MTRIPEPVNAANLSIAEFVRRGYRLLSVVSRFHWQIGNSRRTFLFSEMKDKKPVSTLAYTRGVRRATIGLIAPAALKGCQAPCNRAALKTSMKISASSQAGGVKNHTSTRASKKRLSLHESLEEIAAKLRFTKSMPPTSTSKALMEAGQRWPNGRGPCVAFASHAPEPSGPDYNCATKGVSSFPAEIKLELDFDLRVPDRAVLSISILFLFLPPKIRRASEAHSKPHWP